MKVLNYCQRLLSRLNYFKFNYSKNAGITIVGVGPGDPKLLTIAAIDAIKKSTLVAFPITQIGGKSIAKQIVCQFIRDKRQMPLLFPMIEEDESLKIAWNNASEKLIEAISRGERISLLCQGDPSIYSTSAYILRKFNIDYPDITVNIIPGITSFNAAAAIAKVPLSLSKESLLISPTPNYKEDLDKLLGDLVVSQKVIVLIKLGKRWSWVREVLIEKKLLDNTIFVKRLGFPDQIVVNAKKFDCKEAPYFSLLIIKPSPLVNDIKGNSN